MASRERQPGNDRSVNVSFFAMSAITSPGNAAPAQGRFGSMDEPASSGRALRAGCAVRLALSNQLNSIR
jgi:hypothetical protein